MNTEVVAKSLCFGNAKSVNMESITKSQMKMNNFSDIIKAMGFISVYRDEFSMINGREGVETIACHPESGVIIYVTSISGKVSTARLYYETYNMGMNFEKIPMDEFRVSEIRGISICHVSSYIWEDFLPQYKMILENAKPHSPWRVIPNLDFFQWCTERDLQFDACDAGLSGPFHMVTMKMRLSAKQLKEVLGIKE